MMATTKKVLILLSVLLTVQSHKQTSIQFRSDVSSEKDDSCVAIENGVSVNGMCTTIQNCSSILADVLANRFDHTVYRFYGIISIVCCTATHSTLATCRTPNTNTIGVMKLWSECERQFGHPCQDRECSRLVCCPKPPKRESSKRRFQTNCWNVGLSLKNIVQVAGGIEVEPEEYTHMAALGYISDDEVLWNCGGSLINNRYVLTAAHCLTNRNYGSVQIVRLGTVNLRDGDEDNTAEDYDVARLIPHPDYNPRYVYNDIGLVELAQLVEFNKYIRPICLPTNSDVMQHFKSMGWGATGHAEGLSVKLLKIDQELFSHEECQNFYNVGRRFPNGIMHDTHICAGSRNSNQSTCKGDSGGPLISERFENDEILLVIDGIVSFGTACGFANTPGVYTKVFPYVEWIAETIYEDVLD